MSRIFISHSSQDNAPACALRDWLAANGWRDVFLDLDPQRGLIAGERWQGALTRAANRCEAVIFIVSPAWAASKWCLAEFLLAKSLGKRVFGVIVSATSLDDLPREMTGEFQVTNLVLPEPKQNFTVTPPGATSAVQVQFAQEGLARLLGGLQQAGLDAKTFLLTPGRPLYPGLRALDIDDAAIFFGRDADIVRGMDKIRRMRGAGKRILVILGASGSGKSSFLRAGLWPRLQRSDREFLVLPVMRPQDAPISGECGLIESLHRCAGPDGLALGTNRSHWRELIQGGGLGAAITELTDAAYARLVSDDAQKQNSLLLPILPIDQSEELFQAGAGSEAAFFLKQLAAAIKNQQIFAIFTIRSDSYAHLQGADAFAGSEQELYSLPPISKGAIKDVIEGPALREQEEFGANGLKIDPLLTERLMNEWSGEDALPLLAFTMQRLVDDYGGDHLLELSEYEISGGFTGALEAAIAKAMLPFDKESQEALVRRAFVPWLVSIDSQTREPLRKTASLERLPADAETRRLVQSLINARILTSHAGKQNDKEVVFVEVAHEALLRQWPMLAGIIDKERDALSVLNEVKRDAASWDVAGRTEDALLHRGGRLSHAFMLLVGESLQNDLGETGHAYLNACRKREDSAIEQVRTQQSKIKRAQRWATVFLLIVVFVIATAGIGLVIVERGINQRRADMLANLASDAYSQGQFDRATRFALAGMAGHDSPIVGQDISRLETTLASASQRSAMRVEIHSDRNLLSSSFSDLNSHIVTASLNGEGTRIVTVGSKSVDIWDALSGRKLHSLPHVNTFDIAAFDSTAAHFVTVSGHDAVVWHKTPDAHVVPTVFPHEGDVLKVAISSDGTHVVTWSRGDNIARLWDTARGSVQKPVELGHIDKLESVKISADGSRVVTLSQEGNVSVWGIDQTQPFFVFPETLVHAIELSADGARILTISNADHLLDSNQVWRREGTTKPDELLQVKKAACLWDTAELALHRCFFQDAIIKRAIVDAHGAHVALVLTDGTAHVLDTSSGMDHVIQLDTPIKNVTINSDGTLIATVSEDETIRLWDADTWRSSVLRNSARGFFQMTFSKDNRSIVAVSSGSVMVLDTAVGREINKLQSDSTIVFAEFNLDRSGIVTYSTDGTAYIWDAANPMVSAKLEPSEIVADAIARNAMVFSANGSFYAAGRGSDTARIYAVADGQEVAALKHDSIVFAADFNGKADRVATVTEDGAVHVWDVGSRRELAKTDVCYSDGVRSIALSRQTNRIAVTCGGYDQAHILVLNADAIVPGHQLQFGKNVQTASISGDGSRVVTTSEDNTARIWDASNGRELASLEHAVKVRTAVFSSDGMRVVTTSNDKTAHVWNTRFVAGLHGQALVDAVCEEVLSVNVKAPQFSNELGRLTDKELQMAPVLDPAIDIDVCRPTDVWQRAFGMFSLN